MSGVSTDINFGSLRLPIEELVTTAAISNFSSPRLGWTVSAGGIVGGEIDHRDITGGGALAGQLSWLPVYENAHHPFVAITGTAGVSYARAAADDDRMHGWLAVDLRGGVTVGKTFAERFVPYVSARGFGGPVYWQHAGEQIIGNDRYHVTFGGGLVVRLPASFDATLEAMPLGEKSMALGVTRHI